jgi:hypothetical protein
VRVQGDAAVTACSSLQVAETGQERGVHWVGGWVIVEPDWWALAGGAPHGGPVTIVAECRLADALS